jgi:hypothetical protein
MSTQPSYLLRHGLEKKVKDPDPKTLLAVANALDLEPIFLFRLAGYIPAKIHSTSIAAEYLAHIFDELPPEKQQIALKGFEGLLENKDQRELITKINDAKTIEEMIVIDYAFPALIRVEANRIVVAHKLIFTDEVDTIDIGNEELVPGL